MARNYAPTLLIASLAAGIAADVHQLAQALLSPDWIHTPRVAACLPTWLATSQSARSLARAPVSPPGWPQPIPVGTSVRRRRLDAQPCGRGRLDRVDARPSVRASVHDQTARRRFDAGRRAPSRARTVRLSRRRSPRRGLRM